MSYEHHEVEFESRFVEGGWTALCSCGWSSERHDTMTEASGEWEDHLPVVHVEPQP